jgi:hypothetical protein
VLFAVLDGDELLAVATAWLSTEHYVEVKLIGGRDHRRWLKRIGQDWGRCCGGGSHAHDRHWARWLDQNLAAQWVGEMSAG